MWWSAVRLVVAGAAVGLVLYGVDRVVELSTRRLSARAGTVPQVLRGCRKPILAVIGCGLLLAAMPWVRAPDGVVHLLVLATIGSCGWLTARAAALLLDGAVRLAVRRRDAAWAGRARTQVGLLSRILQAAIALLALAAMLMTFPAVRVVGTSLLASAGLVGVVAGIAAQSALSNLFAGIQMAFGDLARIGDVVVVGGEWGTVEEITLTAVVIATWDQRRIVMPMSYFAGRPFENWSRRSERITGTALLHLDHSTPVDLLRAEFDAYLAKHPRWDGEGSALQVVDTTPSTLVVRALATAANAGDAFELRCDLREHLVAFLREHHPHALPRLAVAAAPGEREPGQREPGEEVPWEEDRAEVIRPRVPGAPTGSAARSRPGGERPGR